MAASVVWTSKREGATTTFYPPVTDAEAEEAYEAVASASTRRNVTRDLLERTADAYRTNKAGVHGVMAALGPISEAQAYRYIKKAREAGLLEHWCRPVQKWTPARFQEVHAAGLAGMQHQRHARAAVSAWGG